MDVVRNPDEAPVLSRDEQAFLLRVARETLESYLETGTVPSYEKNVAQRLMRHLPAFVTLKRKNGELRGCIGRIEVFESLIDTVQDCAVSAATRDYRFPPVSDRRELDDLVIEISVLSPFREIHGAEEIQVGRHGLLLRKGFQSGLLLPQVATERNWGRDEFLRAICMKAGLPNTSAKRNNRTRFRQEPCRLRPTGYLVRRNSSNNARCFGLRLVGKRMSILAYRSPNSVASLRRGMPFPRKRNVWPF